MKFYSEKTRKLYDTEKDLQVAEQAIVDEQKKKDQLKAERAERAKEVEEAISNAQKLLDQFVKDYGSYHTTIRSQDSWIDSLFDLMFRW